MLFNQLCYYNDADVKDVDSLEALTRRASKIIGRDIQSPREIYNKAALKKMYRILKDDQHPLYGVLKDQESKRDSSKVMRSFTARTNRFRDSFVPTVIRLHNAKSERRWKYLKFNSFPSQFQCNAAIIERWRFLFDVPILTGVTCYYMIM